MAFLQISQRFYIALSSDIKTTDGPIKGSICRETDTERDCIFDGSAWIDIDPVSIAWEHHRVHLGKMWRASKRFEAVADDASADIVIVVGLVPLHAIFNFSAGGDANQFLYEGPTHNSASAVNVRNASRPVGDSGAPSAFSPTVTVVGDELHTTLVPGGSAGVAQGSAGKRENEWILSPSTDYLFRLTNKAGQAKDMSWDIDFYEAETF